MTASRAAAWNHDSRLSRPSRAGFAAAALVAAVLVSHLCCLGGHAGTAMPAAAFPLCHAGGAPA